MHIRRDKVYTVFEAYLGPAINYVLGTGNGGSFTFSLSLLSNATSYASIFDQYRIAYAEVDFVPATSVNTINVGGAYPPLYTAIDYDGNVSNTVADLVQYQTAQYAPLGAFLQRRLNPRCLLTVSAGSVADALASPRQWVDMANTAVPYFGVSWAVGPGPASNIGWTTTIRLCVQFKNPR